MHIKSLTIAIVLLFSSYGENPETFFGENYTFANTFLKQSEKMIIRICNEYHIEPLLVMSVGFPELNRYSMIKDLFETSAVELMYVNGGTNAIDFSIGHFQMKASFVEKLELFLSSSPTLSSKYNQLISYNQKNDYNIRKTRVERLQSTDWQIKYIVAFIDVMLARFPEISEFDIEKQIAFLATAYNYNFMATKDDIFKNQDTKSFPYGINKRSPFSYSEISLYFYNNHNVLKDK